MKESIINWIRSFYYVQNDHGVSFDQLKYENQAFIWTIMMVICLMFTSLILWWVSKFVITKLLIIIIKRTKIRWDNHLKANKVFRSLAHVVPLLFMDYFLSIVFYQYPVINMFFLKVLHVMIVFTVMISINRCLNALCDIVTENIRYQDKPIKSYFQVAKITSSCIFFILMLSVITNQTPMFFITSLGAMTAIVALIFKDTILGFVSSLQLSSNDMVRIGDWITMDKFGADGDVIEINIASVKIQNFDKTITTIPTYSFISDSFKNWRGMKESDGRRIKRAINLQIDSVQFASDELIQKLKKITIFKEFLIAREIEIKNYNLQYGFTGENAINARKQTNIGLFRRYIEYYVKHNPHINQEMTIMIRQLAPTENGVPIEVYCFTKVKDFEPYEVIVADIFDHIFAMTQLFDLRIFENPTGYDFRINK
ncbi:MAG: mechanosensitive ion channel [Flavobacteriia bacterium]|nr:mechanosensitive ion channel [Flavobacteriia bacterium]